MEMKKLISGHRGSLLIAVILTIAFMVMFNLKEKARKIADYNPDMAKFKFLELAEMKAYDFRFQLTQALFPQQASDKVVIAAMDDLAAEKYGWPFPRGVWGEFIRKMKECEAEVVAYDMVFVQEREYAGLHFIHEIMSEYGTLGLNDPPALDPIKGDTLRAPFTEYFGKIGKFDEFIRTKETQADQDAIFAAALKENDRVVLGWYGYASPGEAERYHPGYNFEPETGLLLSANLPIQLPKNWDLPLFVKRLKRVWIFGMEVNTPVLSESTEKFGYFTSYPDNLDGTLRKNPMINVFSLDWDNPGPENTFVYPSLALATVSAWYNEKPIVAPGSLGVDIRMGDHVIPTDKYGRLLINWLGPDKTITYYSIYHILTDFKHMACSKPTDANDLLEIKRYNKCEADKKAGVKGTLKGKIVMVGSTTVGAHDMRTTPFGTAPGVNMHANIVSNIIEHNYLLRPDWFVMFDYLFLLLTGVLMGIFLPRFSSITGGIVTLILFLGYFVFNIWLFRFQHYSFTLVYPLAEVLAVYLAITLFRYATEEKEKRFIRGAFAQYMSPKVIDQLVADPSKLKLGGEDKELTAFFSDIQGFSSFSEKMTTQQLVHFLNIYLTEMCDIILDYSGTIDKFEGDAIIAFFGAPVDNPDHARDAVLCTAEIQAKMAGFREQWMKEGWPEVHMRVGLNSGNMSVGNMGSRDRMDYTIMGDNVNLASRLEAAGKQYAVYTMITEETKNRAGDVAEYRELDSITVKGRTQPVRVFEILGKKGEADPKRLEAARLFEKGLGLYRQRYWMPAVAEFKKAIEVYPQEGPSKIFIARCEEFSDNPPPAGWDGVYVMKTK